jgi:RNA polymerase sigma factor (sigma-70 family)
VLVARYTLPAHLAAFLLGAGEEADDVVQEAFVKAFRHLSRFRAGESFGPWLLRIVANETRVLTRSRRRRAALALRLAVPDGTTADGPVDEVLAAERRARLVAAVNALPDRERQVLVCRYFLDLSEAETAQVLACPLGSVKSRAWRGLNRLRGRAGAPRDEQRPPCPASSGCRWRRPAARFPSPSWCRPRSVRPARSLSATAGGWSP